MARLHKPSDGLRALGTMDRSSSIVHVLKRRATLTADRPAFTFLQNGELALEPLTFGQLDIRAEKFATMLRGVVSTGSRIILMLPSGYLFIEALFGCFYAGCVAVPVALPKKRSTELPLAEKIARDADAAAVVTTAELSQLLCGASSGSYTRTAMMRHIICEELDDRTFIDPKDVRTNLPDPSGLAYLQYTSGSTGDSQGVMVRHANIIAAVRGSEQAFQLCEQSRLVSWLPHYHDMGLVGSFLQTVYSGFQCWFMSPRSFTAKPDRWLAAITNFEATVSGGPNFAYELCTRSAAQHAGEFRLGTWQCAYNGSEPVRIETLTRFAAAFGPCGFKLESFRPCYGLAEATLQVSGGPLGVAPAIRRISRYAEGGTSLEHVSVSCGLPVEGTEIRIVDPHSRTPAAIGRVGEIWVRAPQVAPGYWAKPVRSREMFEARIVGEPHDTKYLRTGDVGMLADGELFVLGRYKDMIILNGVNHQPEPIEATVMVTSEADRIGAVAAIGVPIDDRERLMIVAEVSARLSRQPLYLAKICRELRTTIHRVHDLTVHSVILVPHLTLPRTTSGKVRRLKVKEVLLSRRLTILTEDGAICTESTAEVGGLTSEAQREGGAAPLLAGKDTLTKHSTPLR